MLKQILNRGGKESQKLAAGIQTARMYGIC